MRITVRDAVDPGLGEFLVPTTAHYRLPSATCIPSTDFWFVYRLQSSECAVAYHAHLQHLDPAMGRHILLSMNLGLQSLRTNPPPPAHLSLLEFSYLFLPRNRLHKEQGTFSEQGFYQISFKMCMFVSFPFINFN